MTAPSDNTKLFGKMDLPLLAGAALLLDNAFVCRSPFLERSKAGKGNKVGGSGSDQRASRRMMPATRSTCANTKPASGDSSSKRISPAPASTSRPTMKILCGVTS